MFRSKTYSLLLEGDLVVVEGWSYYPDKEAGVRVQDNKDKHRQIGKGR